MSNINKLVQEGVISGAAKLFIGGSALYLLKKYLNGETDWAELDPRTKEILHNIGKEIGSVAEKGASGLHEIVKGATEKHHPIHDDLNKKFGV